MNRSRLQIVVGGVILAVLLVANVIATHDLLTEPHPGHNDFMSRWQGVRSFWRDGLDPYGDEASLNIQVRIYGRPAAVDEDPGYFAYPFYIVLLLWPLAYISFAWASAIWMVASEAFLILALLLLLDLFGWRPRPWLLALLLLCTVLNYFAARGLILGQISHFVYMLQVVTLWALAKRRDALAGTALSLGTIKPQMGFLLVPFLLLWGIAERRWRFVGVFVAAWAALMATSFVLEPGWLQGWIEQLRAYPSYTAIGAPAAIIMRDYLGFGAAGEWGATAVLWAVMLWTWADVLVRGHAERFDWAIMLTLAVTHLSALRTATPHYVVFTIPLVFYFKRISIRRTRTWWIVVILVALLIMPWAQFLLTVEGDFEHSSMYVGPPVIVILVLWFTRHLWWEGRSVFDVRG